MRNPEIPRFSEDEKRAIRIASIELARVGEVAIDVLEHRRRGLLREKGYLWASAPFGRDTLEHSKSLDRTIEFVNEVIDRARVITEIEGTDTASEINRLRLKHSLGRFGDLDTDQ